MNKLEELEQLSERFLNSNSPLEQRTVLSRMSTLSIYLGGIDLRPYLREIAPEREEATKKEHIEQKKAFVCRHCGLEFPTLHGINAHTGRMHKQQQKYEK